MSQRPSLLIMTHEFRPKCGGIAVYTDELARSASAKYQVEVRAPGHLQVDTAAFPYKVNLMQNEGTHNPSCVMKTMKEMRAILFEGKPDILCLSEPGPILAAMWLQQFSRLPGGRRVLILHGSEIQRYGKGFIQRYLFSKLLKYSDRVGVVSEYNRNELKKYFSVEDSKIRVVPGALRHDIGNALRRKEGSDGEFIVLTVARVHPRKGQHAMLEAIADLPEELRARVRYRIVGEVVDRTYGSRLKVMAEEGGLAVDFTGAVPDADLEKEYANADLFALTSLSYRNSIEGYGLVYMEAGYHGLPSLAHAIGGVPEAVLDGRTGLLADPEDRHGLKEALRRLIMEPELCERLGEEARRHAVARSWDDNVRELFDGL